MSRMLRLHVSKQQRHNEHLLQCQVLLVDTTTSEAPPDLIGRPSAHPILLGPAGVRIAVSGQTSMAVGAFLYHHLQIADGRAHICGAAVGGGGSHVGAGGGERVVVGILQGVQSVGLAAH